MRFSRANQNSRIRVIWIFILLLSLVFLSRLYWIQIVRAEYYRDEASHQYYSPSGDSFDRGNIYFTLKDDTLVRAATIKRGFLLAVNPTQITSPSRVYEKLSNIIEIDEENFLSKAGKEDDSYEEITHHLDEDVAEKIADLDEDGLILVREKWRVYPGNSLASHVLGFVGFNENTLEGRYGIERYYNDALSRTNESSSYSNFFADILSNVKSESDDKNFEGDIVTSIEPTVQAALEAELVKIQETWNSDGSGGIIINPQNGEIYAMATYPNFDPNNFSTEEDPSVFSNPIVENVFEMGSIIKPITMAIGLDSGSISPETTYDDKGYLILNGSRISNFDGKGRGVVPMQEILSQSLNTGAAFIAHKTGNETFAKYMLKFGLDEETGIDLPAETHGLVSNLESPRDLEYATASFGQGIALTPIETVRALSSLVNGGYLITPHIAKSIKYSTGGERGIALDNRVQILKAETSEQIKDMLRKVYDEALLDGEVKIKNYTIGAKTGTAQIANPEGGGYYEDRYFHSFFGFLPAYDARFLVFLYTINPKEVRYSSQTLTSPFVSLSKFIISYYNLAPDR